MGNPVKTTVREYNEGMAVEIDTLDDRWIIIARNEAGYNSTQVDMVDLIEWLYRYMPEVIDKVEKDGGFGNA